MVANELIEGFGKRIGIELGLDADVMDDFNIRLFSDRATIEGNIMSLNHALDRLGSRRVMQLHTTVDDDATWSLFLINRHEVRTQCVILPEKD